MISIRQASESEMLYSAISSICRRWQKQDVDDGDKSLWVALKFNFFLAAPSGCAGACHYLWHVRCLDVLLRSLHTNAVRDEMIPMSLGSSRFGSRWNIDQTLAAYYGGLWRVAFSKGSGLSFPLCNALIRWCAPEAWFYLMFKDFWTYLTWILICH